MGGQFWRDSVGMSESIGVAVLVGMTIVMTATVGLSVLVFDTQADAGPQANFTFDYVGDSSLLLITHSQGDEFEAGTLELEGPQNTVTWAEVANTNESALVGPGDIAQLSSGNAYGAGVAQQDTVTIYYNTSGNRTQLDEWSGG
ncbi:type IV pilin N-terminal domain-containing protein [Halomicroarcula sp. GCM10025709]|uniref:type IV pilin N-terminal domain-containing protein n=1 Tax=Haloarcula TaxID=2237 RepID=UPI0024C44F5A|nr:type IV pilin N-terminal domain-containing protein [Halomicroarcula sp. YJ-61-S]